MKKLLLPFILFQSSFILCSAQQTNLDSLHAVWLDKTQPDSARTAAYQDYIWDGFLFSNPDSAFALTKQLLAFAKENNYQPANAIAYELNGHCYFIQGLYPKAVDEYERSLSLYQEIDDQFGAASIMNSLGRIYTETKNFPLAIDYFSDALEVIKQFSDQGNVASTMINLGGVYIDTKEYDKALAIFDQALKIAEGLEDEPRLANIWGNYGFIYLKQQKYAESLLYSNKALEVFEKNNNGYAIIIGLSNVGQALLGQGKIKEGIGFCDKSLTMAIEFGATLEQIEACNCVYTGYKSQGNLAKALEYHERLLIYTGELEREETTNKLQKIEFEKQLLQDSIQTVEKARKVEEAHTAEMRQEAKTRNIAFGIGGFLLLLAGGLYGRNRYIKRATAILQVEKDRSENLLLNILPEEIAQELKIHGKAEARDFDLVSILFTDFKGFTQASAKLSAADLVHEINFCFEAFDGIMEKYGIEKIKTIGDAYMAAGGLPVPTDASVKNTVLAAIEMQVFISTRKTENDAADKPAFEMRVGIHTGPVVAGIVGVKKFQYDIWGDTVNTASRMESAGEVGKVNISQATYELLREDSQFTFESRGKIEAKGKGEMEMYFVKFKNGTNLS